MKKHLFLIIALLFAAALGLISCTEAIKGNGKVKTVSHVLGSFDELVIEGMYQLELIKGDPAYELTLDENLHDYVSHDLEGGRLVLGSSDHFFEADTAVLRVSFEHLNRLEVNGACQVWSDHSFTKAIEIIVNGAADIDLELDVVSCELDLNGGCELDLMGKAKHLNIDIVGAADVDAFRLVSESTDVRIAGAGDVKTNVVSTLNVTIQGAGNVTYIGSPKVNQNIVGVGEVKQRTADERK